MCFHSLPIFWTNLSLPCWKFAKIGKGRVKLQTIISYFYGSCIKTKQILSLNYSLKIIYNCQGLMRPILGANYKVVHVTNVAFSIRWLIKRGLFWLNQFSIKWILKIIYDFPYVTYDLYIHSLHMNFQN